MTTSASTTFSPSSRRTTRSTPCVLGCCGPMLITSSFVSNIAPRTVSGCMNGALLNLGLFLGLPELQPVDRILHEELAGPFERIVFALRKSLPVVGHQDASAIRVAGEVDAEHVPHFAFEPVRRGPHARRRRQAVGFADLHLDADAMAVARRIQAVDDVEA